MSTVQTSLLSNTIKQLYRKHTRNSRASPSQSLHLQACESRRALRQAIKNRTGRLQCKQGSPSRPQVVKQKTYQVTTRYQSTHGCMAGQNSQIILSARQPVPLPCSHKTYKTFRQLSSPITWQDIQQADLCGPRRKGLFSLNFLAAFILTYFFVPPTHNKLNFSQQNCCSGLLVDILATKTKQRCCLEHYCDIVFKVSINSLKPFYSILPGSVILTYFGC